MTNNFWVWIGVLGTVTIVALCLAFHFSKQRWPRVIAVAAGGAMVSILIGETSAVAPLLITGVIMAVCSATAPR